jgi:RNA polymerase sigma-70 factor (ECF subfamily)
MVNSKPFDGDSFRQEIVGLTRALLWDLGDLPEVLNTVLSRSREAKPADLGEADLRKWYLRTTVLAAHDLNRKRRPRQPDSGDSETDLSDELRLEDSYRHLLRNPERLISGLGQPLRNALIQLSELDRAVFLLRSMCELRYSEIADTIDVPVGTVMGSLVRSRIKLRRALAEQIHEV